MIILVWCITFFQIEHFNYMQKQIIIISSHTSRNWSEACVCRGQCVGGYKTQQRGLPNNIVAYIYDIRVVCVREFCSRSHLTKCKLSQRLREICYAVTIHRLVYIVIKAFLQNIIVKLREIIITQALNV